MEFSDWMDEVDNYLVMEIGLTSSDLEDQCYRDMYDSGLTPKQAAKDVLACIS